MKEKQTNTHLLILCRIFTSNPITRYDELVTPYTNGFLKDAPTNPLAENVLIQSLFPLNVGGHISQMFSSPAFNSVLAFFDRSLNQNINCLDSVR